MQKAPSPELWSRSATFAGTLVNVRDVLTNMVLSVCQSSPNFARLRQSSHEGALMLPVYPGICLTPRVTLESFLGHFNCFSVLGSLGGTTDHKIGHVMLILSGHFLGASF